MVIPEKDIRILVVGYKPFVNYVHNPAYTIITTGEKMESDLETYYFDRREDGLDDRFFSELYACKWARDNGIMGKKYTGVNHYRRHFKFMDDIPNLEDLLSRCEAITPKPTPLFYTIEDQYRKCHNIDDFNTCRDVIEEKFPEYLAAFDKFAHQHKMIRCNMSVMKTPMFIKWIDFVFGVLDGLLDKTGRDIYHHIRENDDKYIKKFPPNDQFDYQYRFGGYLGERLTNVFILKEFKNVCLMPVVRTEDKYAFEKLSTMRQAARRKKQLEELAQNSSSGS